MILQIRNNKYNKHFKNTKKFLKSVYTLLYIFVLITIFPLANKSTYLLQSTKTHSYDDWQKGLEGLKTYQRALKVFLQFIFIKSRKAGHFKLVNYQQIIHAYA